ncbi:F0F1 ATP synthase subunit A [Candidatus Parcubacteria bacterium]|nr:F0F1 ATP synthase subunit A [Patescibacteria group bacterium]MBU4308935.1 F0F1 ATP synthase subunit A [Patescibacteria group bacterium]MBU4431825.1 F0F1 ATP synthase subunit A [Patescibacteria group bacterium]MBU4577295.1 F0F1 ATP synthase subunit A [Patescibacteria group bacterium]MCG2696985.1 F0F1 ATP synthase subunit A [Candidatus Parcubacteria bacterium]
MSNQVEQHNEVQEMPEATEVAGTHETQTKSEHGHTLYAEEVANVGGFPITNSMINTWMVVAVVLIFGLFIRKRIKEVPTGLQNVMEMVVEGFLGIFDSVTSSREKSLQFFPFVFSFFILILLNNWMGLLPGIGSIGKMVTENGHEVFAPFFRGGTADLNTTLALAIIGVVASHIFGVVALGWWRYLNKFVNIKAILDIPKKVMKDPTVLIVNPIHVFVGLIEIVGEIAKVASLSFRLFGNVFAGEVLLASMAAILAFGLPIPFMFMEVIVGVIQALIFAMLILAYLTMSTTSEDH